MHEIKVTLLFVCNKLHTHYSQQVELFIIQVQKMVKTLFYKKKPTSHLKRNVSRQFAYCTKNVLHDLFCIMPTGTFRFSFKEVTRFRSPESESVLIIPVLSIDVCYIQRNQPPLMPTNFLHDQYNFILLISKSNHSLSRRIRLAQKNQPILQLGIPEFSSSPQ